MLKCIVYLLSSLFLLSVCSSTSLPQLQEEYYDIITSMKNKGIISKYDVSFLEKNTSFVETTGAVYGNIYTATNKIVIYYSIKEGRDYNYLFIHELGHYVQFVYKVPYTGQSLTPYCEQYKQGSRSRTTECFADMFYYNYIGDNVEPYYRKTIQALKRKNLSRR